MGLLRTPTGRLSAPRRGRCCARDHDPGFHDPQQPELIAACLDGTDRDGPGLEPRRESVIALSLDLETRGAHPRVRPSGGSPMTRFPNYKPEGVIPATLLLLNQDLSIDEKATRKHLRDCAFVPGVNAVTVNGHASEVHACTFDEQERLLAVSVEEVGDKVPVICGVYADGSMEAARLAAMAERRGASALLVFPPNPMAMGGQLPPEIALVHFKRIADATGLPLIVFQYSMAS